MYKINKGLIEWTLDINSFVPEFYKKCNVFNIIPENVRFYSQQDEDKYIIQYLLKNKIDDGTYLEIGACDGLLYSNTKTLEDFFNFTGILIEPQDFFFNNIKNNRSVAKNELYNCAVTNNESDTISFIGNNAEAGVENDINTNLNKFNWNKSYNVPNKKMKDILQNSKFKYIDFMIIDVEGSELSLLKSIDFNFPIYCIIIEAHSGEQEKNRIFGDYLKKNGFTYKERQRGNEIWINHNYFRKDLFNQ
jgi:FkbM family methyltransferase